MEPKFCDNHLLVAIKPAGVATQPDFCMMVKVWLKEEFKKPGNVFCEPLHRLDRPVGGLLLFARTSKALSRLNETMRARLIEKHYLARVEGKIKEDQGRLEHLIAHGSHRAHIVQEGGKQAVLSFVVKKRERESSLIEIRLETGRYHQIRAQLAAIGHPICGDEKYGGRKGKLALSASRLSFPHPVTQELLTIREESAFFV